MNAMQREPLVINWYAAEVARWRARGRRLLRFTVRLTLALAAVAAFMYVTGLIEGIR